MNTVPLGEICKFVYGKSLPTAKREPGAYPVFGSNGTVGTHTTAITSSPAIVVGRKGSIGQLNYSDEPCWPIDTTYYVDETSTSQDIRWLYYALTALRLPELNKATGVPGLNRNDAYEKQLYVPALDEQRRIAAILDKADAIRRKREQALNLADDLLKSTFLEMFGNPATNERDWVEGSIDDCLKGVVGGWSAKGEARPAGSDEMGVLKISAVTSGEYLPQENKVVETIPNGKRVVIPQLGDLLFSRANTRELVAATCIVTDAPENVFLPDKLWRLEPEPEVAEATFLKFVLSHPEYREGLCARATGTSGSMLNISKAKLLSHPIPVPDIDVQRRFTKIWQSVQSSSKTHRIALGRSEMLFASLSQRAFRGEL